jgi:hypothetical protein
MLNANEDPICDPAHFNSMRAKPKLGQALIENNISSIRPYPDNWTVTQNLQAKTKSNIGMRCLFEANNEIRDLHLRSIDSLTNKHLLNNQIDPSEDYLLNTIGHKRYLIDLRNGFEEKSPGDKSYKAVEYSPKYFYKNTHSRDPIKRHKRKKELAEILNIRPSSSMSLNNDEFDSQLAKNDEIFNVRLLDTWQAAQPLRPPFKVIDLEDKTIKYRPKVTK